MSTDQDPKDRLEDLDAQIEQARRDAADAGLLPEADDEQRYVDSGNEQSRQLDDQEIAPPG
jgi:hypothetical protein